MRGDYGSLMDRLWRAALLLLATAVAMHVGAQLVEPLLPMLLVAAVVVFTIKLALGRRRW